MRTERYAVLHLPSGYQFKSFLLVPVGITSFSISPAKKSLLTLDVMRFSLTSRRTRSPLNS